MNAPQSGAHASSRAELGASKHHTADLVPPASTLKASSLLSLLDDCASWMNEGNATGLSEMPDIRLQLKGDGNEPQTISLPGWSYVYEVMEPSKIVFVQITQERKR